ncbi:MAG: SatD family protein [Firmicutes bacterium]|nr:SatD family protein [Bacillota bacterium]
MTDRYIAVKLDIRGSRRTPNRASVQERLFAAMDAVNAAYGEAISAKFVVTHGDEAQGMLWMECAGTLFRIVETMVGAMRPVRLRFGVGVGTLSTPARPEAIGMDGEAWHRAQAAIELAAKERKFIVFRGFGEICDARLGAAANLLLFLSHRWTNDQRRTIAAVEKAPTQSEAAAILKVSPAAVSKSLRTAGWQFYRDGREVLEGMLEALLC